MHPKDSHVFTLLVGGEHVILFWSRNVATRSGDNQRSLDSCKQT